MAIWDDEGEMEDRGNFGAITTRQGSDWRPRDPPSFLWVDLTRDGSVLFEAIRDHFPGCKISNRGEVWPAIKRWGPVSVCFEYDCQEAAELQVLRETRYRHPDLPILMLTTYHSEDLAVWAFRAGVWDYLVKPIAREMLIETLQALLACSRSGPVTLSTPPPPEDGSPPPRPGTVASRRYRLTHRTAAASAYIAKNYASKITVAAAAEQCHLSCSQFSRIFKKEHRVCFQQYLVRYRINQACKILASFEMPVKEVAFSVGFTDPCYFARAFRKQVRMLPSAFKAHHRSQDCLALPAWDGIADMAQANRDLNIDRSWDPGATARTETTKPEKDRPRVDPSSRNRPAAGDPEHSRIILSFSRIVLPPSTGEALV